MTTTSAEVLAGRRSAALLAELHRELHRRELDDATGVLLTQCARGNRAARELFALLTDAGHVRLPAIDTRSWRETGAAAATAAPNTNH